MTRDRDRDSDVPRNNRGFTLLEVMVAVAILAFVLVSLQGLNNRSVEDVMLSERITTATLLAKRMMAKTLLATPLVTKEDEGEFPEDDFKDYTWKVTISPTPITFLFEVRVAVLWKEGARQEMVELVSYE
jgi:general secretion pathway protein I